MSHPDLKVIKLFSYSTQLSMKFQLLIESLKKLKIANGSCFKHSDVVLSITANKIYVKMTIDGISNFYEHDKFHTQWS